MSTEGGLYIGLMSGTSMDGVDGVLVEFSATGRVKNLLAHHHQPFEPALRDALVALQAPGHDELHRAAMAANSLVRVYAAVVESLVQRARIDPQGVLCVCAHGQTVRHRPELGYTWQINNPALLAELTRMPVVADLRARDIAAGGQGAPLVPAFHQAVFSKQNRSRLIVNLGGICNVTLLHGTDHAVGYDIGPANVLLDLWVHQHLGEPFDRNGAWASIGEVDDELLDVLLAEPFFKLKPPKSTGRDLFHAQWLHDKLAAFGHLAPEDVQRTLVELTAVLIAEQAEGSNPPISEVVLCGGGTYNLTLREALQARLADLASAPRLKLSSELGIAAEHVEAMAFAWLGWCHLNDVPANLPEATGAVDERVLGSYTPD
ncbi:MAG TPA: anhydro-N-acetylmuramic acid kinase [Burkholderiaceae bacterium]|nr:anhydro-N-acetylmuramic acid kinase [Burkholderiaceae bacterium]